MTRVVDKSAIVSGGASGIGKACARALARLDLDADILVNCAGVQHVAPVHEFPPEKFSYIVRLMLEPTGLSTDANHTPYPRPPPQPLPQGDSP